MRLAGPGFLLLLSIVGAGGQSVHAAPVDVVYDDPGLTFTSDDNSYQMNVHARFQFRYATPDDSQPLVRDDYFSDSDSGTEFGTNRARLKVKGYVYQPWLRVSLEYELKNNYMLDYRFMIEKYDWLKFKLGQWKLEYSRERSISSGGQQMLDRSIINRHFTIDRHQGAAVYGHLDAGSVYNFNYWAGVATGTGRGSNSDDDSDPLYYGRIQWNFLGKEMGFIASDYKITEEPVASIGYAAATNRSRYTRFSSSGGGSLTGFSEGEPGQYEIQQFNIDAAFLYAGLSAQAEYHEKEIDDRLNALPTTRLSGFYVQAGYFLHQSIPQWPEDVELAARFAKYEPDSPTDNVQTERAVALNWFLKGHKNKITADATWFEQEQDNLHSVDEWRYRVQWDVSF